MLLITICGASASGKTALARGIEKELSKNGINTRILGLDSYYICHPEMTFEQRTALNYDAPDSFDFDLLKEDIKKLRSGMPITTKVYDYAVHLRHDKDTLIYPPQVLILEGIHSFCDREILESSDLRLYVDTDADECIVRRMCRDVKTRDRTVDLIAKQYLDTVKPMFDKYIRLYRNDADICVVGGGYNARAVRVICEYVKAII